MPQRRRRVAILYTYNENWIGSTYYIQNLISALNKIPDQQKPDVVILAKYKEEFNKLEKITGYPFLSYSKLTFFERVVNNFTPRFLWENFIGRRIWSRYRDLDLLFPATHGISFASCKNKLFWVADFQEHYLPGFFSEEEVQRRKKLQAGIVKYGKNIVLSSQAARRDFNEIFPGNGLKQYVLPFAVTHPPLEAGADSTKKKYNLPADYFICSNQFWKHKNHIVVLKAIAELKKQGREVFVAFTGKMKDYRNPQYFDELTGIVKDLGIDDRISFLGFISREDQLLLMKNTIAVIQPSLFEGWSTVVEDAKSLKVKIIASDIDVHKEQLVTYTGKFFFDPANVSQLAECMKNAVDTRDSIVYDYQKDILTYGNAFSSIIDDIKIR